MKLSDSGFTKTSVETETIGSILKKMREDKDLGLEKLSLETKIQIKYLRWIEEDNYKKLPPQVYVEGFLKSCAKYFEEDPKKIISLFRKEQEIRDNISKDSVKIKKIVKNKPIIISLKTLLSALVFVLAAGAYFYIYKQADFIFAPPKIQVFSPPQDVEVFDKDLDVIGIASEGSQISINSQSVYSDESGKFQEKIYLNKGLNVIRISAENKIGKKTEIVRNIIYNDK